MARGVLASFARKMGLHLAEHGFETDGLVFRRWSGQGDVIVVDLQPSQGFEDETRFHANLGLVLAPVWRWDRYRVGPRAKVVPGTANGIWRGRIRPPGDASSWEIATPDDADGVFAAVIAELDPNVPTLLGLLDHDVLRQVTQDRPWLSFPNQKAALKGGPGNVAAWLAAEEAGGPTPDLSRRLFGAADPDDPRSEGTVPMARTIWAWARSGEPWYVRPEDEAGDRTRTRGPWLKRWTARS